MDQPPNLLPEGLDLNKLMEEATKRVGLQFGIGLAPDGLSVELRFSIEVQQIFLTPKEANRMATMLRRTARECAPAKKYTPPPRRDKRYMEPAKRVDQLPVDTNDTHTLEQESKDD